MEKWKMEKRDKMATRDIEVKFPCGYEIKVHIKDGMFDSVNIHGVEDLLTQCPLHGKKCKQNAKTA